MYSGSVYIVDTLVAQLARVALETPGTPAVFQRRVWRSRPPKLAASFIKVQSAVIILYHEKAALLLHVASPRRKACTERPSARECEREYIKFALMQIIISRGTHLRALLENLPPLSLSLSLSLSLPFSRRNIEEREELPLFPQEIKAPT